MRLLLICTVTSVLLTQVPARTTQSLPQSRQAGGSDLSTNSTSVRDWADRLLSDEAKVRASAEASLVQGAQRSLPLLRRFLVAEHEDLHETPFEIIRRIGPPAIPLLVDLLGHEWDSIRRNAADALIDLAPDTDSIQPVLRRALEDQDAMVAGDAARALGALGTRASASVDALVSTLSHENPYVRIYAAEALASIGPPAARATPALARALDDPTPGVRWAACEALGSIGPAAQSAVPQLIEALEDEFLYVRIFAAGALGSIGPKAQSAREALKAAASDPAMRNEAEWALSRIAGVTSAEPVTPLSAPAPSLAPTMAATVVHAGNPPVDWDTATGRNIVWSVELGRETYGRPVVAGDAVYVGTDNARFINPPTWKNPACSWHFERTMVSCSGRTWPREWSAACGSFCCRRRPARRMWTGIGSTTSRPSANFVPSTHRGFVMARTMVRFGRRSSRATPRPTSSGSWTCAAAWVSFRMKPPTARCCRLVIC